MTRMCFPLNILQDIFSLKLNPLGHFMLGMIFMITQALNKGTLN